MHAYEAISVRPASEPWNPGDEAVLEIADAETIARLFRSIYFDVTMDGRGLAPRLNAYVLASRGGSVVRFDVCGELSYFLRHRQWAHMHPIADQGRDLLQALLRRHPAAGPDLRRAGAARPVRASSS
jgi:hypothetical protein